MGYRLFLKKIALAGALSALAYLVFDKWHNWFLGALVLLLYFLFVSAKIQAVLVNYFGFNKSLRIRLLAIFLSLATLGWWLGVFIFFNYFNGLAVFLSFLANALAWSLMSVKDDYKNDRKDDEEIVDEPPHAKFTVLVYIGLLIYGFYLLIQSKTGGGVFSPWQIISQNYVWVFLAATFLLGALILFSKVSLKTLLFFLIVHSFLLHSYLPLTHDLFYGADGWRHIANEQRFVEGKGFKEAKLGSPIFSDTHFTNPKPEKKRLNIQKLKTKIGQLSYANFWGTNVVLSKILQVDLISLTKWFLPILWSIIFTILLYEIGLTLGWSGKKSLLLAWAGMLPFALQAGGSFSLPVNFGFLIFVLLFLLLLKRACPPTEFAGAIEPNGCAEGREVGELNKGQKNILLALGVGSAFGYLLFFVLYWLSWVVMAMLKSGKRLIIIPSLILMPLALPALELLAKFSVWNIWVDILAQVRQFMGNLFALYLAGGPRPHDISGGNILFNQIPASIFTPNFLTQWRWWLPAVVLTAFIFIILGIKRNIKDPVYKFILTIFSALMTSYFLSFYLLSGERLFSRRLDATLAFLFLILLFYGLEKTMKNPTPRPSPYRGGNEEKCRLLSPSTIRGGIKGGVPVLIIFSLAITASYTLGPDTFTVSANQLAAASYVWSQEKDNNVHCVLGDTYALLALEAVSAKEIIGGGFPIDASFGQPERENLFKQMNIAINDNLLKMTADLTKTDYCWFVGETVNFAKQGILGGNRTKIFGNVAAVRYNINNN